ncbi:MAG: hypothetical protein L3K13_06205 [Thermoplasmata archaeon]|nr:hypothetical protein [Thermoplasmata archaeon]
MAPGSPETPQLRRLLAAAGYRLSDNDHGLLAWRFEDRRGILIVAPGVPLAEAAAELPADAAHRTLLLSAELGEEARALASELGVELLVPDTLGSALGELLFLPPGPALAEPTPSSEPLEPPVAVLPTGDSVVRPRLGREEAEQIAGTAGTHLTLRLIPFYVAAYRVRAPATRRGPGEVREELVAVNALSGRPTVWNPGQRELVAEIPPPFQRLDSAITEAVARARAEEFLRRRHTVGLDHTEQHEGALVVERRRVPPGPGDLRIGPFALLHVPFWYIEGAEGRVILDAVTGARGEPEPRESEPNA